MLQPYALWISTVIVIAVLLSGVAIAWFAVAKSRRAKEMQELERVLAQDRAQEALDEMLEQTHLVFGIDAPNFMEKVGRTLAQLGRTDYLLATEEWLPYDYAGWNPKANALLDNYAALVDGRSVVDGSLTVHTIDAPPGGYSVEMYDKLAEEAKRITAQCGELQEITNRVRRKCSQIEQIIVGVAPRHNALETRCGETRVRVKACAGSGYNMRGQLNGLKKARDFLTRAQNAIGRQDFLTAWLLLVDVERFIVNTENDLASLPLAEEALRSYAATLESDVHETLSVLAQCETLVASLARRYSAQLLSLVRTPLNEALAKKDRVTEGLDAFHRQLDDLDIYTAGNTAQTIGRLLLEISRVNQWITPFPAHVEQKRKDARQLHDSIAAKISKLRERDLQPNIAGRVTRLERRVTAQSTNVSKHPLKALEALGAIDDAIDNILLTILTQQAEPQQD